jgi:hypothetical protein
MTRPPDTPATRRSRPEGRYRDQQTSRAFLDKGGDPRPSRLAALCRLHAIARGGSPSAWRPPRRPRRRPSDRRLRLRGRRLISPAGTADGHPDHPERRRELAAFSIGARTASSSSSRAPLRRAEPGARAPTLAILGSLTANGKVFLVNPERDPVRRGRQRERRRPGRLDPGLSDADFMAAATTSPGRAAPCSTRAPQRRRRRLRRPARRQRQQHGRGPGQPRAPSSRGRRTDHPGLWPYDGLHSVARGPGSLDCAPTHNDGMLPGHGGGSPMPAQDDGAGCSGRE